MYMWSMFTYVRYFFLVIALAGLVACQSDAFDQVTIGDQVFKMRYAVTPEERTKGLMFVEAMPEDQGMVFLFPDHQPRKFWMHNTFIPLDMLFFDHDMRLIHIEENATPHDLTPRGPDESVCVVVEINGGEAAKRGIKKGDILSINRTYKCLQSNQE